MKQKMYRNRYGFLMGLSTVVLMQSALAEIPAPELNALPRAGGQPGTTFAFQASGGANLDEVDRLIFSHIGITAVPVTTEKYPFTETPRINYGQFQVTIAADVPEGMYEVHAVGRHGVSNPRPFAVINAEHLAATDEHSAIEKAIELRPNLVVWDRCRPQQSKHFVIHATEDQELCLTTSATSIDSRAMLSVTLVGPNLRNIQHRMATALHDLHIHHVCTVAGDYRVIVRDHLFQGGDDFTYMIRYTNSEQSTKAFEPLLKEQSALLARYQRGDSSNAPSLQYSFPETASLPYVAADMAATVHDETAYPGNKALAITIPALAIGEFSDAKDQDWMQFTAAANEVIYIETISQRLGQRTDPQLAVHRVDNIGTPTEANAIIAEQDDGLDLNNPAFRIRSKDPIFRFQAPADGTYRVLIRDLQSDDGGQQSNRWAVMFRRPEPNFTLVAYQPFPTNNAAQSRPFGTQLRKGGTEVLQVMAIRRDGFDKAIELSVEGLPPGVQARNALIAANQSDCQIILTGVDGITNWSGPIKIVGREFGLPGDVARVAIPGTHMVAPNGFRNVVISRLSCRNILSTTDLDVVPLTIQFGDANVPEIVKGQKIAVPIKLTRLPGGQDKCVLRPQHLPAGVAMGEVPLEGNVAEGTVELQTQDGAALGDYTIWLQGETKVKMPWNPQSLARAQQRLMALEAILNDPNRAADKPAVEPAIQKAKEEIDQLTKATAEREFATFMTSTPFQFRIVEPPKP
jgi:hypothetical protein